MKPRTSVLYSVVIPVYNSTETLGQLAEGIDRVFRDVVSASYELIFVDDGSLNPKTWETLQALARERPQIRAIQLARNFGQIPAILCGMEEVKGDYVLVMDDDGQHRPENIPRLIAEKHHDVVVARFRQKRHTLLKRMTSKIKGLCDRIILGKPSGFEMSSFFLLPSRIARGMLTVRTSYPILSGLIFSHTRDVVNVQVDHRPRMHGKSGYTFVKRVRLFANLLINYSSFLLSLIGYLGVGISGVTLLLTIYFVVRKLFLGVGIPGWTSLMVAVLFLGGILLFSVGIIGKYLVRIIQTLENRPSYFVRHKIENET